MFSPKLIQLRLRVLVLSLNSIRIFNVANYCMQHHLPVPKKKEITTCTFQTDASLVPCGNVAYCVKMWQFNGI